MSPNRSSGDVIQRGIGRIHGKMADVRVVEKAKDPSADVVLQVVGVAVQQVDGDGANFCRGADEETFPQRCRAFCTQKRI